MCAVRGCHNSWNKRKQFLQNICFDHNPRTRAECGCGARYDLYPPPKEEESLRLWLKALNLKHPPKRPYVCSFHFVDRRPTEDHPFPEKWLGCDAPVKTRRRRPVRTSPQSGTTSIKYRYRSLLVPDQRIGAMHDAHTTKWDPSNRQ